MYIENWEQYWKISVKNTSKRLLRVSSWDGP
jgi:hypothetical protein